MSRVLAFGHRPHFAILRSCHIALTDCRGPAPTITKAAASVKAATPLRFNHMVLAHYNVSIYGEEAFDNRIVERTLFKELSPASIKQPALVKRSLPGI